MLTPAYQLSRRPFDQAAADLGCTLHAPHIPARGWEWEHGPAVILMANNATDTAWCSALPDRCTDVRFPRGRLAWKSTLQGQLALYFGADQAAFGARFARFGVVWTRDCGTFARRRRSRCGS